MRVSPKRAGLAGLVGSVILTVVAIMPIGANEPGNNFNNHPDIVSFKVAVVCTVRSPMIEQMAKRVLDLPHVTSRTNPTPTEVAEIERKRATCAEWQVAKLEHLRQQACSKSQRLTPSQRAQWGGDHIAVATTNYVLEKIGIDTDGKGNRDWARPQFLTPAGSYYNHHYGGDPVVHWFDAAKGCAPTDRPW